VVPEGARRDTCANGPADSGRRLWRLVLPVPSPQVRAATEAPVVTGGGCAGHGSASTSVPLIITCVGAAGAPLAWNPITSSPPSGITAFHDSLWTITCPSASCDHNDSPMGHRPVSVNAASNSSVHGSMSPPVWFSIVRSAVKPLTFPPKSSPVRVIVAGDV